MSEPLVSIIIAAWNAEPYLSATLASALGQSWTRLDIILVDDGSTDGTPEAVAPFLPKIRYERQTHRGLAAARNRGLELAGGEFVALLDADDLWHPEKVAQQVAVARRHPEAGLIACDAEEFTGNEVRRQNLFPRALSAALAARGGEATADFHRQFIDDCSIACPAQTLIPRTVIDRVGRFIHSGAQDYDYYLRISERYPVTFDQRVLARWRLRDDSMSGPTGNRRVRWALDSLPVLAMHRERCRPEHRRHVERRISRLLLSLAARLAMHGTPRDRRRARAEVARLAPEGPWSAVRLALLSTLQAADLGHRVRATHRVRRVSALYRARPLPRWLRGKQARIPPGEEAFVDARSEELERLIPADARVECIARGFGFTEGPVWLPDGVLLFGDLPNNVIWRWSPSDGVSVMRKRSGYAVADRPPVPSMGSNGMALDCAGRLTVCEPGNRRITRTEADGTLTVVASHYDDRRLNSPNDLVYRADGSLYFSDPPHGLPLDDEDPAKELAFNGVYRLRDGRVDLLTADLSRPNGLAFAPDEQTLYVSNSDPERKIWMRYGVRPDGSLARGAILLDLTEEPGQAPDGLDVDAEGNLYLTGPGGLWIVSAEGAVLGIIRTRHEPSNVTWGGEDRRELYITARTDVYRLRTRVAGAAFRATT